MFELEESRRRGTRMSTPLRSASKGPTPTELPHTARWKMAHSSMPRKATQDHGRDCSPPRGRSLDWFLNQPRDHSLSADRSPSPRRGPTLCRSPSPSCDTPRSRIREVGKKLSEPSRSPSPRRSPAASRSPSPLRDRKSSRGVGDHKQLFDSLSPTPRLSSSPQGPSRCLPAEADRAMSRSPSKLASHGRIESASDSERSLSRNRSCSQSRGRSPPRHRSGSPPNNSQDRPSRSRSRSRSCTPDSAAGSGGSPKEPPHLNAGFGALQEKPGKNVQAPPLLRRLLDRIPAAANARFSQTSAAQHSGLTTTIIASAGPVPGRPTLSFLKDLQRRAEQWRSDYGSAKTSWLSDLQKIRPLGPSELLQPIPNQPPCPGLMPFMARAPRPTAQEFQREEPRGAHADFQTPSPPETPRSPPHLPPSAELKSASSWQPSGSASRSRSRSPGADSVWGPGASEEAPMSPDATPWHGTACPSPTSDPPAAEYSSPHRYQTSVNEAFPKEHSCC